jgi:hypothetical protein
VFKNHSLDIEKLEYKLKEALTISNRRIALLDKIRARPRMLATKEEQLQLRKEDAYGEQNICVPALPKEVVALMLEQKTKKKKYEKYKPFILDISNERQRLEFSYKLKKLTEAKKPFHYDLILFKPTHYSPLQIDYDGEKVRMFYIDAAGDTRNLPFVSSLGDSLSVKEGDLLIKEGGLQFDHSSCSTFSIQHLNTLFSSMAARDSMGEELIDPALMKHIQSTTKLKEYIEKKGDQSDLLVNPSTHRTLKAHINNYNISVKTSDAANGQAKLENHSVDYKTNKYLKEALRKLEQLKEDASLEEAIDNRMNFSNKDSFYEDEENKDEENKDDTILNIASLAPSVRKDVASEFN